MAKAISRVRCPELSLAVQTAELCPAQTTWQRYAARLEKIQRGLFLLFITSFVGNAWKSWVFDLICWYRYHVIIFEDVNATSAVFLQRTIPAIRDAVKSKNNIIFIAISNSTPLRTGPELDQQASMGNVAVLSLQEQDQVCVIELINLRYPCDRNFF